MRDPACAAAFRRAAMTLSPSGGTDIAYAMRLAVAVLAARRSRGGLEHVLLLTDGQDDGGRSNTALAEIASSNGATWSAMGFGDDHDSEMLSAVAASGRGTFTFVDSPATLGGTFGAFLADATRVVAQDVRVLVTLEPGMALQRAPGAWAVRAAEGGRTALELSLGSAPVASMRRLLLELRVTTPVPGAESETPQGCLLLTALVSARPAGAGDAAPRAALSSLPLRLRRRAGVGVQAPAAAPEALDELAEVANELAVSAAAAALRAALERGAADAAETLDKVELKGSESARAAAEAHLAALREAALRGAGGARRLATSVCFSMTHQRSLTSTPGGARSSHVSKAAEQGRDAIARARRGSGAGGVNAMTRGVEDEDDAAAGGGGGGRGIPDPPPPRLSYHE